MYKDAFYYFKKSAAFFDMKVKSLPRAIFILVLALNALYVYIMLSEPSIVKMLTMVYSSPENAVIDQMQIPNHILALLILIVLTINLVTSVYLDASIREAKKTQYTAKQCIRSVINKTIRLSGLSILKSMLISVGLFMFIIPAVFLGLIFIYDKCAVLDKNLKVLPGMRGSYLLTKRKLGKIVGIELFCNLLLAFFIVLILSIFALNSMYVFFYALVFVISICSLIEYRLIAYMYADALGGNEKTRLGDETQEYKKINGSEP